MRELPGIDIIPLMDRNDSAFFGEGGVADSLLGARIGRVLFFLFPLAMILFGAGVLPPGYQETPEAQAEGRIEGSFGRLSREGAALDFFTRMLGGIERKVFRASDPPGEWRRVLKILKRRIPGRIRTVFIGGDGKPLPELDEIGVPRQLVQRFVSSYGRIVDARTKTGSVRTAPLPVLVQSFVKSFLGPGVDIESELHGRLMVSSIAGSQEFVFLSKPRSGGMFVLFFAPEGTLEKAAWKVQLRGLNRQNPATRLCLATAGEKTRLVAKRLGLSGRLPRSFWKVLQNSPTGKTRFGEYMVGRRILAPSVWVVGATRIGKDSSGHGNGIGIPLLALVLFSLILVTQDSGNGWLARFDSVRGKLILAFLYAAVVPLMVIGLTAQSYLSNRREMLEEDLHVRVERFLEDFDRSFATHQAELEKLLVVHHFSRKESGWETLDSFRNDFGRIRNEYQFDYCQIFDVAGDSVFEYSDPAYPIFVGPKIKLLKSIATRFLALANPASGSPGLAQPKSDLDAFSQESIGQIDLALQACQELQIGNLTFFLNNLLLGDMEGKIRHVAFLLWNRQHMELNHIRRTLPALNRSLESGEVIVWDTSRPALVWPPDSPSLRRFRPLFANVTSSSKSFRTRIQGVDGNLLLNGRRGQTLEHFSFLAIRPDREVQGEIENLAWAFRFIGAVILGMFMIIGLLLARVFLSPIGELTRGTRAMAARDFSARLRVDSRDELGTLAERFNETLESLGELEVAQTLQEDLYPRNSLPWGPWEVFGKCRSAVQVGGDFLDYFPLDPNRALVFLGDVSGHGVGGALVVAMAKATVTHPETFRNPGSLMEYLNGLFLAVIRGKKMMTAILALLDRETRRLTLSNNGHCFPILIRGRSASFVELKGYPLGTVRNWKGNSLSLDWEPGDVLVFYTDGLPESPTPPDDIPIGYRCFLEALPDLVRRNARETEAAIRKWHAGIAAPGPQVDDITVIVVQDLENADG